MTRGQQNTTDYGAKMRRECYEHPNDEDRKECCCVDEPFAFLHLDLAGGQLARSDEAVVSSFGSRIDDAKG